MFQQFTTSALSNKPPLCCTYYAYKCCMKVVLLDLCVVWARPMRLLLLPYFARLIAKASGCEDLRKSLLPILSAVTLTHIIMLFCVSPCCMILKWLLRFPAQTCTTVGEFSMSHTSFHPGQNYGRISMSAMEGLSFSIVPAATVCCNPRGCFYL